jgi:hypothetical protein
MKPKEYWDKRARGLGGRITSCGEENLLNLRGDRYSRENILIHEFAHCIHEQGLRGVDPKFDSRLRATFARAMDKGLWKKTYAATNHKEYWAEAVQVYFDCNAPPGGVHNDITTREKLAKYDPDLFQLIDEVFKKSPYRYVRYDKRNPRGGQKRKDDPRNDKLKNDERKTDRTGKDEPPRKDKHDPTRVDDHRRGRKLPNPPDACELHEAVTAPGREIVRRLPSAGLKRRTGVEFAAPAGRGAFTAQNTLAAMRPICEGEVPR